MHTGLNKICSDRNTVCLTLGIFGILRSNFDKPLLLAEGENILKRLTCGKQHAPNKKPGDADALPKNQRDTVHIFGGTRWAPTIVTNGVRI